MGVATAVESQSIEKEATSSIPAGDKIVPKSEFTRSLSQNWLTVARGFESSSLIGEKTNNARGKLRSRLEKEGIIFSESHQFTLLVKSISEKLEMPQETTVMVVDNEELNAFYNLTAKTIVVSRGFARHFLEELPKIGIEFGQDHLAALIAHEVEHAEVLGDKYLEKLDESYEKRWESQFSHAEEYRADGQGMKRLAKAGYNPKAMVEIFRTFSLTLGRIDPSHPEMIDRIRKLEDLLADDEHPIPHTTKQRQSIAPELLTWFSQDSEAYKVTDTVIRMSPQEIHKALLQAPDQKTFWDIYTLGQHVERVSLAKGVLSSHQDTFDRIVRKAILVSALRQRKFIVGEKEIVNQSDRITDAYFRDDSFRKAIDLTSQEDRDVLAAEESHLFRDLVSPSAYPAAALTADAKYLSGLEQSLDAICQKGLSVLAKPKLSQEVRGFLEEVKRCYEQGSLTTDVFITAHPYLDKNYIQRQHQKDLKTSQEHGIRAPGESTSKFFDISDTATRSYLLEQMKLGLAIRLIGEPTVKISLVAGLAKIITQETQLPDDFAQLTAGELFAKEYEGLPKSENWPKSILVCSKEDLAQRVRGMCKLGVGEGVRLSPYRPLHRSISASKRSEGGHSGDYLIFQGEYNYREANANRMKRALGFALFLSGKSTSLVKPGEAVTIEDLDKRGWNTSYEHVDLSFGDWDTLKQIGEPFAAFRTFWLVDEYAAQIQQGKVPDENLVKALQNIKWPEGTDSLPSLSLETIKTLLDHSPWPEEKLREVIDYSVARRFGKRLPPDNLNLFLEICEQIYPLYKSFIPPFTSRPYNDVDSMDFKFAGLTQQGIVIELLGRLFASKFVETTSIGEATATAIRSIVDNNLTLNKQAITTRDLYQYEFSISNLSDAQLTDLLAYLKKDYQTFHSQRELYDYLLLYSQIPQDERKQLAEDAITDTSHALKQILTKHPDSAVEWLVSNIQPSVNRDRYLIGLYDLAPDQLKGRYFAAVIQNLSFPPDNGRGCRKSSLSHLSYLGYKAIHNKSSILSFDAKLFKGFGRVADNFDDVLQRRHAFATLGLKNLDDGRMEAYYDGDHYGSSSQRFQALRLYQAEPVIFDRAKPMNERVNALLKVAADPSVVRDIHLEMMFRDELQKAQSSQERVTLGKIFIPLFTENSSLRNQLGAVVFKAELRVRPEIFRDYDEYMRLVSYYLPAPSLARNSFLNQIENSVSLTPDQLREIDKMRISSEGKASNEDDSPLTFVVNKMGELNREEKIQTLSWLLGLSSGKSRAILKLEKELDGHLNNLPVAVAGSTDTEREILFKRLFLGAEGILDMEAVQTSESAIALSQRREFIQLLARHLLPDEMPQPELFRDIFTSILESSDPAHATRTLTKLLNKFNEFRVEGKQMPPEEVIAVGLSELGVVGKKTSQSLAELDWVPDPYKKALRRAQSEGEVVPKRALLTLAEDAGLLDENSPIRIVSFDELLGAASNKQACLLTIEVTDESVGLPKGRHQVVGKFKRPSAQKKDNIEHDLRVMRQIINVLNQRGYADGVPRDFSAQISDAVNKELDFAGEAQFNKELRTDLAQRNTHRRYKVNVPTIYFTSDDVMLESRASGISLRAYQDLRQTNPETLLETGYGALMEREISQTILVEGFAQLINTGNVHTDLHPGNIFVNQQGNITLIDLGMHQKLTSQERQAPLALAAGLVSGNEEYLKKTLRSLGWDLGETTLGLTRFNFADNIMKLLKASQKATTPAPEVVTSIILATSKISIYTGGFTSPELFKMLVSSLGRREAPKVVANLARAGFGAFLR